VTNLKTWVGAKADPGLEGITPLSGLATDCLRLSMYFFHPIQQCAQQVYSTAIPLSPTSSLLRKFCLQTIINNHLSPVTDFMGAPHTWGLLLRTIDTRPRELTCITTSGQSIISACGDIVNIYDAVTGVLQQAICVPERVIKMQCSPDGSMLFLAHDPSVTMWDVQTGGLIHTFTAQSKIHDIAVSTTHIACGLADGSVMVWGIHTREKCKRIDTISTPMGICWLSAQVLAVAAWGTICIHNIIDGKSSNWFRTPSGRHMWGMVHSETQLLVGIAATSNSHTTHSFFQLIKYTHTLQPQLCGVVWAHDGELRNPTLVGKKIACISPATGVQLFDPNPPHLTKNPPLLGAARSLAVSLGRNIITQTDDSIQIFSSDVLTNGETHEKPIHLSHIYPLGKKHIICVQSDRHLIVLELETLKEFYPDNSQWSLISNILLFAQLSDQSPFAGASLSHGLLVEVGISQAMELWKSGTEIPKSNAANKDVLSTGLSPKCTLDVSVHKSLTRLGLWVTDPKDQTVLSYLPIGEVWRWEGYNLIFESETRFYLKRDGPGQCTLVPFDIIPQQQPWDHEYSHKIIRGEPVQEPLPPYTLDANCEWVIDAKSRKICWIPPGNISKDGDGHFWAGLSLVMLGGDGVVRKLSFREPDC